MDKIKFIKLHQINFLVAFSSFIFFGLYINVFATYAPGETLNPTCAPGISGCIVSSGSSSQWTTSNSDIYFTGGNVGIGTTTPTSKMVVKGSAVIGSELVTNGTFNTDTTGWELGGGASYNAGKITTTGSGTPGGYSTTRTNLNINVEAGKSYLLTFTVSNVVGNNSIVSPSISSISATLPGFDTDGNYSTIFASDYTGVVRLTFQRWISALASSWSLDNVSIKEIDEKSPIEVVDYNNKKILSFGNNSVYNFFVGPDAGFGTSNLNSSFLGNSSGYQATSASWSNFLGEYSGYQATYAGDSNFMGEYSGYQATYAGGSNFMGAWSGYKAANVWGSNFLGYNAGSLATDASYSNFIGYDSGYSASGAAYSNFIGNEAGYNATSAWDSNFIGPGAGGNATNSAFSNFMGYNAGYGATNASNSIFIGKSAGQGDTVNNTGNSDDFSILIGKSTSTGGFKNSIALGGSAVNTAMNQLTIGSATRPINKLYIAGVNYDLPTVQGAASTVLTNNGSGGLTWATVSGGATNINELTDAISDGSSVFLGTGSGVVDDGTNNQSVGIGINALNANISGFGNIAIGSRSMLSNTTGGSNTAIGYYSLSSNISGNSNVAMGPSSLQYNTYGYSNTAIGPASMYANKRGVRNTAVGDTSLYYIGNTASAVDFITGVQYTIETTGTTDFTLIGAANSNPGTVFTATGPGTGTGTASSSSSNNASLGYGAGEYVSTMDLLKAPSNSIFIGSSTKALVDGGTNEIVIGYNAVGNGSNTTTLGTGNVLYVGGASVSGMVARFTNSAGYCDINPLTTSLTCTSDIRLKKNIYDLNNNEFSLREDINVSNLNILDKLLALTPVTYNWRTENDTDLKHIGFIAQEMEQVFPDLVFTDINTGTKSVAFTNLIPYTVEAIKDMDLKVKDISSLDTTKSTSLGSLIKGFLEDTKNSIDIVFFGEVHTKKLCLDDLCITKDELKQLIERNNVSSATVDPVVVTPLPVVIEEVTPTVESDKTTLPTTIPVEANTIEPIVPETVEVSADQTGTISSEPEITTTPVDVLVNQ